MSDENNDGIALLQKSMHFSHLPVEEFAVFGIPW
ncbi:MAG: hypothetical protein ACI90V_013537, partial [Bacillariaceae sp.]